MSCRCEPKVVEHVLWTDEPIIIGNKTSVIMDTKGYRSLDLQMSFTAAAAMTQIRLLFQQEWGGGTTSFLSNLQQTGTTQTSNLISLFRANIPFFFPVNNSIYTALPISGDSMSVLFAGFGTAVGGDILSLTVRLSTKPPIMTNFHT